MLEKYTLWTFRWYICEQFLPQNLSWWKKTAPPHSESPVHQFRLVYQPSLTRLPEFFGSYDISNIFVTEYQARTFNLKLKTTVLWLYHDHYIWWRKVGSQNKVVSAICKCWSHQWGGEERWWGRTEEGLLLGLPSNPTNKQDSPCGF